MNAISIVAALEQPLDRSVTALAADDSSPDRDSLTVDSQSKVTVIFPSGRRWSTTSQMTFLSTERGMVSRIVLTPLSESASFGNAADRLSKMLAQLDMNRGADAQKKVDAWKESPPSWDLFAQKSGLFQVEPGIELFAAIKPASEDGKWLLSVGFYSSALFSGNPTIGTSGK